jgi:uncharacterized glyoxalase superfamily protein PhnB
MGRTPVIGQVNLVVSDLAAAIAFYRLLGFEVEEMDRPEWAPHHARIITQGGARIELDSIAFARQWNPGLDKDTGSGGCVLFVSVASRGQVDRLFHTATEAGYRAQKSPEDAFWGARYAIVEDPDGHAVGFMSEIDPSQRRPPPPPPS